MPASNASGDANPAEGDMGARTHRQLALEQECIDVLYRRLDAVREGVQRRLEQAQHDPITGTPGSRSERDALVTMHEDRLRILNGVDDRLCFGRLDLIDGATRYIGRIGLFDEANNPLLMDWRADAAAAFYQATAAVPQDVVLRRHIATAARRVTGVDDDVLMLDALTDASRETVTGHDSLLTALDSARTGRMRDIVSTIQAEQDRIIRSELRGILVVQGGPGTGKTVVALHRVAYLLYAHRDRIARSGALIVGPNSGFLSYIDKVLPALGETGVLMRTLGQLHPGVDTDIRDSPEVAGLKGDIRMAAAIKAAVCQRQRVPASPINLLLDGTRLVITPADVAAAIRRARDTRKPHNAARVVFVKDLLNRLAGRLARSLRINTDDDNRLDLIADLRENKDVRREVNLCWMPLSAERLLSDFYEDATTIAELAGHLSYDEQTALQRPRGSPWTLSDVALLDEAAELLGEYNPDAARQSAAAAAQRASDVAYAREVLASSGTAAKVMTAEQLADRFGETASFADVAERAAADREWSFGHVVVDEAQELSAMDWRMVMRRIPSRSMTIVGDPAQTGSAAGVGSWDDALRPYAVDRWRLKQLTINYRTPTMIMRSAAEVLAAGGVSSQTPRSVRDGRWPPQVIALPDSSVARLAALIADEEALVAGGTVAVITSVADLQRARAAAQDRDRVTVCTVTDVKGLEFDSVIMVEPAAIVEGSARPPQDLYVAMTRPTQRLVIAHTQPLPSLLVDAF